MIEIPVEGVVYAVVEEPDHKYSFISSEENVDYVRIVREAPKGTPFILVEERNRFTNRVRGWVLMVHTDILSDRALKGHFLGGKPVEPDWGITGHGLYPYRYIYDTGKCPGKVKQRIEQLKKILSGRDTETTVEYR